MKFRARRSGRRNNYSTEPSGWEKRRIRKAIDPDFSGTGIGCLISLITAFLALLGLIYVLTV